MLCALFAAPAPAGDGVRRYGAATPGSGNVEPTIWVNQTPRPGASGFKLRVERALGGTWAFPFLAPAPADFQYGGVRFQVDTLRASYYGAYFLPGQGNGGGRGDVPMPLPNNRELVGTPIYLQAFTLDDFAPNLLGIAATTGLRLQLSMPAQLLLAQDAGVAPMGQTAVELGTGRAATYDPDQIDAGRGVAFAQDGAVALALDPAAGRLRTYDASAFPPRWLANGPLGADGQAQSLAVTPDGRRAYVLYAGAAGASPPVRVFDMRAGANFARPWPGRELQLELVADPLAIVFTADGKTAYVAAAGPRSGGSASLTRIDTDPTSPTFHEPTGVLVFPGRVATGLAADPLGLTLYVPLLAPSGLSEVAVVDGPSFTERDMDAGAPGVQALGGERSVPRTPLPTRLGRAVLEPRGEVLYCSTVGGVLRVDVEPASPTFRSVLLVDDKLGPNDQVVALATTDAGEALYVATDEMVVEYAWGQGPAQRTWTLPGIVDLALR